MSTITKSGSTQVLSKFILIALCSLCLLFLCCCAGKSGEEGIVEHAVKYANARSSLDMTSACVVRSVPDAKVEISVMNLKDASDGAREIEVEPAVISDTIASWSADEWAVNRDDLYFNFAAHFTVICKQAHELGDLPENYSLTCPDYMVVYDSKRSSGFIVTSTGVYQKTNDPDNPKGDAIVLTDSAL